jgi:hypothetical protein
VNYWSLLEVAMDTTIAQMSKQEFEQMLATIVEEKLLELIGDPDEGLELRQSVRARLLRQKKAVAAGERGEPFEDVVRRLGLG